MLMRENRTWPEQDYVLANERRVSDSSFTCIASHRTSMIQEQERSISIEVTTGGDVTCDFRITSYGIALDGSGGYQRSQLKQATQAGWNRH